MTQAASAQTKLEPDTTPVDDERLDKIIGEFAGYVAELRLSMVHGTPTMGEFLGLLYEVKRLRARPTWRKGIEAAAKAHERVQAR